MDSVSDEARRDKMAAEMFGSQEYWTLYLDWLDGLVVQAKARGYTEEQARNLVVAVVAGKSSSSGGPDAPESRA